MTFENVIHFLPKKVGKTSQGPNEQPIAPENNNTATPLMEPNRRRVLANEWAAKVATLEKAV